MRLSAEEAPREAAAAAGEGDGAVEKEAEGVVGQQEREEAMQVWGGFAAQLVKHVPLGGGSMPAQPSWHVAFIFGRIVAIVISQAAG